MVVADDQALATAPRVRAKAGAGRCEERILALFDEHLLSVGGRVSELEMRHILSAVGMPMDHIPKIFASYGYGSEGKIAYREFINWLFVGEKVAKSLSAKGWEEDMHDDVMEIGAMQQLNRRSTLVTGQFVLDHFRRVFDTLQGDSTDGVTPRQLEVAMQGFAKTLPAMDEHRLRLLVSEIFEEVDKNSSGTISWEEFVAWLQGWPAGYASTDSDEAAAEFLNLFDKDGTGRIYAQELMSMLLFLGRMKSTDDPSLTLTPSDAGQLIRDLAPSDNGTIDIAEFIEVLRAVKTASRAGESSPSTPAHLVLNFDVNNTVVMIDTATGADSTKVIATVISNSAWGAVEADAAEVPARWVLAHPELTPTRPSPELKTFKEFIDKKYPFGPKLESEEKTYEMSELVKKQRREAFWTFTDPGMLGEALRPQQEQMETALRLPEGIRGSEKALAAGLTGDEVQLLPSFLHLIRELKRAGRSFTLIFRTFGQDIPKLEHEFKALCEGRHPLFPEDDPVVLDGSDGLPDYRMRLGSVEGCGSFFRDPAKDDFIALVMGTNGQPETLEEGMSFFKSCENLEIYEGVDSVFAYCSKLGTECRTVALRDCYKGWAATESKSHGGKPFFLEKLEEGKHSIFFDDHISPANPKIVDPINAHLWPRRFTCPQVYGTHLVQAQPLLSVTNSDYFLECIRHCEMARQSKIQRWQALKALVTDLIGIQRVLSKFVDIPTAANSCKHVPNSSEEVFRPWAFSRIVTNMSEADTFESES